MTCGVTVWVEGDWHETYDGAPEGYLEIHVVNEAREPVTRPGVQ